MSFHRATALVGACAALAVPFVACSETHFDTLCDLHPEQCCDLDPTLPGCGDVGAEASTEGGETSTEGGTDADAAADADADAPTETGPLCTKGEIRCTGPDLEQCATDGMSWLKLTTCPSASTCDAKAGRCTACTPDAYRCDGAKRLQCDKLGKTEAEVATCDTLELCVASTGATCAKAACAVGEKKCEGAKAMVCNAGRTGFDSTTCASAALCAAGVCTSPSCSAAEKRCSGKKVQTCKADLTGWDDTETCAIDCDGGTSPACLKVTQLACGALNCCVRLTNSSARCWGQNAALAATGVAGPANRPTVVPGMTGVTKIALGPRATAAVRSDDTVYWWGSPPGLPSPTGPTKVVLTSATAFSDVAFGHESACLRTKAGGLLCFGQNRFGALGDGTITDVWAPSAVAPTGAGDGTFVVGAHHVLSIGATGAVGWGANHAGQLGLGSTLEVHTPTATFAGAVQIATSQIESETSGLSCARNATGNVFCAGDGLVGDGSTSGSKVPVSVIGGATTIAVGERSACAVLTSGGVACWGQNENGQLGNGATTSAPSPVTALPAGSTAIAVALAKATTCVLFADQTTVKCWGLNDAGLLGINDAVLTKSLSPVTVLW